MPQPVERVANTMTTPIIWDKSEPKAVVNLIPPGMLRSITAAAEKRPELFQIMDEHSLWKTLGQKQQPTPTDNRCRLNFWLEYERVLNGYTHKMEMTHVYGGICSPAYFTEIYCRNPEKAAWLLTPPASYKTIMEEGLAFGLEQLRKMLSVPDVDEKGRPNTKLMELKAKIVAMLDMRVKGAVTQRIETKAMNLNITRNEGQVQQMSFENTMAALDEKIKKLEAKTKSQNTDIEIVPDES